jgi:hypothetical protein
MITKEFRFHIYAKDKCLFHSLQKEDFDNTWNTLKNLVGLMNSEYSVSDLSYEQVEFVKDISSESSH